MRRTDSISIGPGAASLILVFVMLSMSVLAMLSVTTSRDDLRLSERSLEVAQQVYALHDKAEETLARLGDIVVSCEEESKDLTSYLQALAGALPAGMTLENIDGRIAISWEETGDAGTLSCAVSAGDLQDDAPLEWLRHDLSAGTEDEWNW